jgi:hypothetical protein
MLSTYGLGGGEAGDGEGGGGDAGAVGDGLGDGDATGLGDADGDAEGLVEGDAVGEGEADGVALQPPARKMYWVLAPLQPRVMPDGWEYQSRILAGRALMKRFIVDLPTCSP